MLKQVFTEMHVFIFLETFLLAEVFKLSLVPDRRQESRAIADILLAVTAHFQSFLIILQADIGAELLYIAPKPNNNQNNLISFMNELFALLVLIYYLTQYFPRLED